MNKLSIPPFTERQANLMLDALRAALPAIEDKSERNALRSIMINIKEAQYAEYSKTKK